jgi:putative membrane protein
LAKTLGLLSMFAFWGAIIVGIVLLVRWLVGTNAGSNEAQDPALETLGRRYAAGEISHEEYDRMLEAIERRSSRDDRH